MGAEPWQYFVPFEKDISTTLRLLREREFAAGSYYFPGEKPNSIENVIAGMSASGTRSILDMLKVSELPEIFAVSPFGPDELKMILGTDEPTHDIIEARMSEIFEVMDGRGEGRYIIINEDGRPKEVFFAGYSLD